MLAIIVVLFLLRLFILLWGEWGARKLVTFSQLPGPRGQSWPKVSLIIPARNEEEKLEKALESVLAISYPNAEVIVVDDRSTDGTAEILARLSARFPSLKRVRIDELPKGWLGKNHALQVGARAATGDYLLFTDADVHYERDSLQTFVAYAEEAGFDQVTALPDMLSPSFWLDVWMAYFGMSFMLYFNPWNVSDPKSKAYVGIGAFNLVRRTAYMALGGHEPFRLRADDDVQLGKLFKEGGYRCQIVIAREALSVVWHETLRACVRGLEKSILPGFDYRFLFPLLSTLAVFTIDILPFFLPFLTAGLEQGLAIATIVLAISATGRSAQWSGRPFAFGFFLPWSALVMEWATLRNTLVPWLQGGIYWRETFYSLKELRGGHRG